MVFGTQRVQGGYLGGGGIGGDAPKCLSFVGRSCRMASGMVL